MKKLTNQQEKFIRLLIEGYTQKTAYTMAYPESKSMSISNIYSKASQVLHYPHVQEKYNEIKRIIEEELQEKAIWTREQSIYELKELLRKNRIESDRYEQAYEDEMGMLDRQIKEKENELKSPKGYLSKKKKAELQDDIDNLKMARIMCNRRHQSNKNVNEAILNSIQQLNEMLGYNRHEEKKAEEQEQVVFTNDIPEDDEE